jgi:CRP-like cAMP-binding protein
MALISPGNSLVNGLGANDRAELLASAADFDFPLGHVFTEPGDFVENIYFVEDGIISAVALMVDGRSVEAYMVGREGFVGSTAWQIPSRTSVRYVAQMAGKSRRIEARRMREIAARSQSIRVAMATYDAALQRELEQSTACNAIHGAEQRFAKWLLRAHDRASDRVLNMTQEFLANMLGSQRTTVNEAAQNLTRRGAITYSRGRVTVLDRYILEDSACECYGAIRSISDSAQGPTD